MHQMHGRRKVAPTPGHFGGSGADPARGSPTVRRRELGARLRALRVQHGLTVEQVAEHLLVSASKVSRLETGQRGASARDIRDLARLFGLEDAEQRKLAKLAAEGRQRAWWQPFGLPYSTYVGLESDAVLIRDFALGLVPGLLQTPDYARAILTAAVPHPGPEMVEHLIEGRIVRQQRLLAEDSPAQFQAILEMTVLRRVVGSRSVMRAQLNHLLDLTQLPSVTVRVVPYEAGALPSATNKFIILSFASPGLSDVVFIEGMTGDLYLDRDEDIEAYTTAFRELGELAATASQTRAMIASIVRDEY
jgi:transcriptional regulator with XRE-family HTH domain